MPGSTSYVDKIQGSRTIGPLSSELTSRRAGIQDIPQRLHLRNTKTLHFIKSWVSPRAIVQSRNKTYKTEQICCFVSRKDNQRTPVSHPTNHEALDLLFWIKQFTFPCYLLRWRFGRGMIYSPVALAILWVDVVRATDYVRRRTKSCCSRCFTIRTYLTHLLLTVCTYYYITTSL